MAMQWSKWQHGRVGLVLRTGRDLSFAGKVRVGREDGSATIDDYEAGGERVLMVPPFRDVIAIFCEPLVGVSAVSDSQAAESDATT